MLCEPNPADPINICAADEEDEEKRHDDDFDGDDDDKRRSITYEMSKNKGLISFKILASEV